MLDLAPRARWVAEQYPMESVQEKGKGRLRVTFVVSETAWLERLLLRLGPDATVVSGAEGIGRAAAERVLACYGRTATAR